MKFSRSTHLLLFSWETLTSITRIGKDEVLSINPSTIFFLRNFNVHHKDWLTYSGGSDWPGELWWFQMALLRWLTFLLGSQTVILIVLLYLFLLMLVFVLQWFSCNWKIVIMLLPQFPFTTGCPISLHSLWLFSCWLGWFWWSFERYSMGEYL